MNWVNRFDLLIIHLVNQFAHRSWLLDEAVGTIANNIMLTGGMITALVWHAWVRDSPRRERDRSFILAGVVLTTAALVVARTMALLLPFRERPFVSSAAQIRIPFGLGAFGLIHWSSFPSDHATMYFALAMILCFVSRKLGALAFCHAIIVVCVPLLYFGYHYPTDLIAGALVGVGVASLAAIDRVRLGISHPGLRWRANSPATFYPALYLCTLLTATQFDSVRTIAYGIWKTLKRQP